MKKRLRKKKHLGEFRQMGFSVDCRIRSGLSEEGFDRFIDHFMDHAIEANGLIFGGGGSPEGGWRGVICRDHRYDSTTDAEKGTVQTWFEQRPEVESFELSGFWDVWQGSDPLDREIVKPIASRDAG